MNGMLRSIRSLAGVVAFLGSNIACTDHSPPTSPEAVTASEVAAAVTPQVAASLDDAGRFSLDPAPRATGEIGADRARDLATAYWRTFSPMIRSAAAWERDAPVAQHLVQCGRVFHAESAYEPLSDDTPDEYRRANGSQWLVRFCSGSEQQLVIAVTVEATDLVIDANGRLTNARSGDFLSLGITPGAQVPLDPEFAVVQAARDLDIQVAGVPVFRRPAQRFAAAHGTWSFPISSPRAVRGGSSGVQSVVSAVYYGHYRGFREVGLQAADPRTLDRSRDESYSYALSATSGIRYVTLTRRMDTPFELERVTRGTQ